MSLQKALYSFSVKNELNVILVAVQLNTYPGNLFVTKRVLSRVEKYNQTSGIPQKVYRFTTDTGYFREY